MDVRLECRPATLERMRMLDSLRRVEGRVAPTRPDPGPLPTRAFIESDDECGGFKCLVEWRLGGHRGGHENHHGSYTEMLRWALEKGAEEFFLWNNRFRDWDVVDTATIRGMLSDE